MGTLLEFRAVEGRHSRKSDTPIGAVAAQIVIFPGVRIERHEGAPLDLGHRLRDSAGRETFDGIGGGRPRKSS